MQENVQWPHLTMSDILQYGDCGILEKVTHTHTHTHTCTLTHAHSHIYHTHTYITLQALNISLLLILHSTASLNVIHILTSLFIWTVILDLPQGCGRTLNCLYNTTAFL